MKQSYLREEVEFSLERHSGRFSGIDTAQEIHLPLVQSQELLRLMHERH